MLSFFRKLSIGTKIRDGLLPNMENTEDVLKAKNHRELILKDENELKETIYGAEKNMSYILLAKFMQKLCCEF